MKRYTVSQAREALADLLNEVERGGSVVVERRGVEYEIRPRPVSQTRPAGRSLIETIDASLATGQWSWEWRADGVRLRTRKRRS